MKMIFGTGKGKGIKWSKKRYAVLAGCVSVVLFVCAVCVRLAGADANAAQNGYWELRLEHGDLQLTFLGEGTTAEGSIRQEAGFDVTAVDFVVEESCAASGDEVKKGDAIYRLSLDSMEEAVSYYEEKLAKAAKAAERAKTAYASGVAEAEYTKTEAKAKAGSAKEVYDAANDKAQEQITEAQAAIDEAQAQIAVYQTNLDQDVYETDAGVREKKKSSEEAEKAEKQAQKEYQKVKGACDEAALALENQIAKLGQSAAETADGMISADLAVELCEMNQTYAQKKEALNKAEADLQAAQETAKKALEEYRTAVSSCEKAENEAAARKEELENSLTSLQRAYTNAVNAASLEQVQNQNTYDTAVLQGEYAEADYDNTEATLKAEYDTAQKDLDQLKEEQAALLALEDGVVTAAYDGILSEVPYEAGNILQSGRMLAGYSDTEALTVAVEVSQEDVAKIAVGDTAKVRLPGVWMGNTEGEIRSIASAATSGRSISNVTYTVEVSIDNENGMIPSGASAYVTFSYGEVLDADYILSEALYDIDRTSAMVKVYGEDGEVEERQVTIGETAERYTVITEGLDADTVCVIEGEVDAGYPDAGPTDERRPDAGFTDEQRPDAGLTDERPPDAGNTDMKKDGIKTGGNENETER